MVRFTLYSQRDFADVFKLDTDFEGKGSPLNIWWAQHAKLFQGGTFSTESEVMGQCEKGFYTLVGSQTGALYKNQREATRSQQWSLADNPQGNRGLGPTA
jgi:hypothetical protein